MIVFHTAKLIINFENSKKLIGYLRTIAHCGRLVSLPHHRYAHALRYAKNSKIKNHVDGGSEASVSVLTLIRRTKHRLDKERNEHQYRKHIIKI